jgi:hypothetical protein
MPVVKLQIWHQKLDEAFYFHIPPFPPEILDQSLLHEYMYIFQPQVYFIIVMYTDFEMSTFVEKITWRCLFACTIILI